jgi:multiple sugar transport system substrate-binding protein
MNYKTNLATRLKNNDSVDLFVIPKMFNSDGSNYIKIDSYSNYCEDFRAAANLDLSNTFEGLMTNSSLATGNASTLYFIPFGGEVRGLFVNKTLLASLNLSIPTTYTELVNDCKLLAGADPQGAPTYVPLQGNPDSFAQLLYFPEIANRLANGANAAENTAKVSTCADGVEEIFKDSLQRLYDLMANYYYDYDYCETNLGNFKSTDDLDSIYTFLDIRKNTTTGLYEKKSDLGNVPFMPWTLSSSRLIDKIKEDYGSQVDYEFILSPTSDDGGVAYLSPSNWIAMNKQSTNAKWSLELLNYLFSTEGNSIYAKSANLIPNSKNALSDIQKMFNVPAERVCHVGQVAFSYDFFTIMKESLKDISKGNKPKYMNTNSDGTLSIYSFDHYLDKLKTAFDEQRKKLAA